MAPSDATNSNPVRKDDAHAGTKDGETKSLTTSSFSSLSFLVALQLFSRLFTSILNQALFRLASPSVFGTAAIQFELVLSTILFLSREGVRGAILRSGGGEAKAGKVKGEEDDEQTIKARNLTFLPFYLGLPLALATSVGYVALASEEVLRQPRLHLAVALYAVAALVELASEPMHNMAMVQLKTHVRVRAEGLGITCKSLVTFGVLVYDERWGQGTLPLVAFALGQLVYSLVVFGYYAKMLGVPWLNSSERVTKGRISNFDFDKMLLKLSMTMTLQSVIKHFLTEGDKVVLSFFSPLQDQGGYAIAVNYGSLIARIVFQPIEETLRVFFSKLLAPAPSSNAKPPKAALVQASTALLSLLSTQVAFSFIVTIFGSAYIGILLPVLLPRRYLETSAPRILDAWVWYIPVLAVNGALEAFLASVAGTREVNRQSRWMVFFSIVYVSVTILFYRLGFGDVSLIYANILNLLARIAYCLAFASRYFHSADPTIRIPWKTIIPPLPFILSSLLSAWLVRISYRKLQVGRVLEEKQRLAVLLDWRVIAHVGVGGFLALGCLAVWWIVKGRGVIERFRKGKEE